MKTFTETQKFKQWWLWLLLIALNLHFGYGMYQQFYLGKPYGTNPSSDSGLIIFSCIPLGIFILFIVMRLDTTVDKQGISYRFFPFQIKYRTKKWTEIKKAYIRKYKPISEYGGWGIRFGWGKNIGGAYNVSGNKGLQLELKNGKKILFGTQHPEELEQVVAQYQDKI